MGVGWYGSRKKEREGGKVVTYGSLPMLQIDNSSGDGGVISP